MFRFFRKPKLDHPQFGRIRFHSAGHWEGDNCFFPPLDREIHVSVTAGQEGPSDEQSAFFERLSAEYDSLVPVIEAFLKSECDIESTDMWESLSWDYLQITNSLENWPQHWQAGFTPKDGDLVISLEFNDFKPKQVFVHS